MKSALVSVTLFLVVSGLAGHLPRAQASESSDKTTCERVTSDAIEVEGMIDDWGKAAGYRVGGQSDDTSFAVRCAYDDERLYVMVRVFDDYVYRGKQPSARKDDHLVVTLMAPDVPRGKPGSLVVYPGNDKEKPRRTWNGKALPDWLLAEDTLQRRGWSLEIAVPLARIPGLGQPAVGVAARIEFHDADIAARVDSTVAFDGMLTMADQNQLFGSFLKATKLRKQDIRLDRLVNVDDRPGPERVVAGGKVIGILSDGFFVLELPVRDARDVRKVDIVDLRGDGTMSILTELRQYGQGGSRDIVAIWQVAGGGQVERVLAFEVRKEMAGKVLANRWSLVAKNKYKRGKSKTARGHDIVIEVADSDVTGWDEDSYNEAPAVDVRAILLPWSDETSAVYTFEGNTALGGDPIPGKSQRKTKTRAR